MPKKNGILPFDVSQKLILKTMRGLVFPLFSALFEEGFFGSDILQISPKEWKLERTRNPSIDRINYNKIAVSITKNYSNIFILFDDMSLLSLSMGSDGTKISFWSVLLSRYDLVLVISVITLLFILNEIR